MTEKTPDVLEFKRIAPFRGCWWRWEYLALGEFGPDPIVWTPIPGISVSQVVDHLVDETNGRSTSTRGWRGTVKDPTVYGWGEDLFWEIPHNYVPDFATFAEDHELPFVWWCDDCGEPQHVRPWQWKMASYRGNGGVGIEASGWLCTECATGRGRARRQ